MTDPEHEAEGGEKDRDAPAAPEQPQAAPQPPGEVNGPRGPEPTRFGDWEKNGRCSDF